MSGEKQEYRKVMNRTMVLMDCEIWDSGERLELPKVCHNLCFFAPIFAHVDGKGISMYYNWSDAGQDPSSTGRYFSVNEAEFDKLRQEFNHHCDVVRALAKSKDANKIESLINETILIWPLIALANGLGAGGYEKIISESLSQKCIDIRKESDDVLHAAVETLADLVYQMVPDEYKPYSEYLLSAEIINKTFPNIEELKARKRAYVYHKGTLYTGKTIQEFAASNNLNIAEEDVGQTTEVKGMVAYKGKIRGMARLVFERADIAKVKEGDILITAMTTPNLIDAMHRAAGFVTDEGGITSHAAIVAREFKKPCIIGTKFATQIFKDGDIVELDAKAGIVRKI